MKTKILLLALICLFIFTSLLAQEEKKQLTPMQIYVKKALQTSLTFTVSKEKSEETWGRIQSFMAKYSSMKIQVVTDFVIETYNPSKVEMDDPKWPSSNYGYSAIKTLKGDNVEFEVNCLSGESEELYKMYAEWNAHFLAYYALTEEILEECIHK